jgi:hypothetical protein
LLGDELLRRLSGRGQLRSLLLAVLLDCQHGVKAGQKVAHLLLLLVVLEDVFDLGLERRKAQGLHLQTGELRSRTTPMRDTCLQR